MTTDIFQNRMTITIARPAPEVYAHLATPDHHVGLHPATASVAGEVTDRPCGVGEMWRERVARPGGLSFDADWIVEAAEPGRRWVVRSVQYGGRPLQVTLAYALEERAGVTTVTRTMTTVAAPYAGVGEAERAVYTTVGPHEAVLTALKSRLEGAH